MGFGPQGVALSVTQLAANQNLAYNNSTGILAMTGVDGVTQYAVTLNGSAGPETITLYTPAWTVSGQNVMLYATFSGTIPTSVQYTFNTGSSWTTPAPGNVVINAAAGTITVNAGPQTVGQYAAGQIGIRDTNNTQAFSMTRGKWLCSTFNPAAPSAGSLVFSTRVADPTKVTLDTNGLPAYLKDYGGSAMQLYYAPTTPPSTIGGTFICTTANSPTWNRFDGADGGQTVLALQQTVNSSAYDQTANFYDAGQLGGSNDALIQALDTSSQATGSYVVVFACFMNNASSGFGSLNAGPLWTMYDVNTTANYISTGRVHFAAFTAQINNSGAGGQLFAPGNATPGQIWAVCTAQKINATWQYRIRTTATVPAWTTMTIGGTGSAFNFNATNFSYGGGSPPSVGNKLTGNAYPKLADLFIVSGVPAAADIAGYETLCGASIGLTV